MNTLLRWVAYSLAIMLIAWIVPGIHISGLAAALLAIVIIGLINLIVKPILLFLTLPLNVITFGLFTLILNALLFMLAGKLSPGFVVDGFWSALLGSLILSFLSSPINRIGGDEI